MLVLDRRAQTWEDRMFRDLPSVLRGDELVVLNNTRVIPARLFGRREGVGAQPPARRKRVEFLRTTIEILLTREVEPGVWDALVRPGRKIRVGERVVFGEGELVAEVIGRGEFGERRVRFLSRADLRGALERLGHVPLPPYIRRDDEPADRERYQTIFATAPGAVAAPTAGLHFTEKILRGIRERGVETCELTLHVGPGTFQPVRTEVVEHHIMHAEHYEIPELTAEKINAARATRRPVLAVGTTVVRALEDAARKCEDATGAPRVRPGPAEAGVFLYPGQEFRVVDRLLTNFHLPKSTLLLLVCALAGREFLLDAYRHATASGYFFYSYGDCMLIR